MPEKDEDAEQAGNFHQEPVDQLLSGQLMPQLTAEGWENAVRRLPPRNPNAPPPMTMAELLARARGEGPTIHPRVGPENPVGPICDGPSAGPLTGKLVEDAPDPQDAVGWAKALLEIERDPNEWPIRLAAARIRARRRSEEGGE